MNQISGRPLYHIIMDSSDIRQRCLDVFWFRYRAGFYERLKWCLSGFIDSEPYISETEYIEKYPYLNFSGYSDIVRHRYRERLKNLVRC